MASDPFSIRIFVPDGNPEGVRFVDRMASTGLAVCFPRTEWKRIRTRPELQRAGVYLLSGYAGDDDLPTLYIGQGDGVLNRIDNHNATKDFWDWGFAFVTKSSDSGFNRAHITWLEHMLIKRAIDIGHSRLDNDVTPREPTLSEADKADASLFLKEIVQTLPLVGLRALEARAAVATPNTLSLPSAIAAQSMSASTSENDTLIVPAVQEGFERVFLGESAWWAVRISGGMLHKIKYIAAYRSAPLSAITHVAPVASIEPFGEDGKYKLIFSEPARAITPIPYADAPSGSMQGPRYTTYARLLEARKISELFGRP
jgi:hypothetical protein